MRGCRPRHNEKALLFSEQGLVLSGPRQYRPLLFHRQFVSLRPIHGVRNQKSVPHDGAEISTTGENLFYLPLQAFVELKNFCLFLDYHTLSFSAADMRLAVGK